ncbi:MAG TPA: hypothetical protein VHU61_11630 [Solirubrobacteraceae bacterium]|nr:hypothetical protein [Solirubrobacteraceae bacterium]
MASFADPTADGGAQPTTHVDKQTPAFQRATQACRPEMMAMAAIKPRRKSAAGQLRYAKCMRAHRVPNFPDPLAGGGFDLSNAVTQSPAFNTANRACGGGKP